MKKNLLTLTAIIGLFIANAAFAGDGHKHSEEGKKSKMMGDMNKKDHDCMNEHNSGDGCEDHMSHEKEHKGHDHKKEKENKHKQHKHED